MAILTELDERPGSHAWLPEKSGSILLLERIMDYYSILAGDVALPVIGLSEEDVIEFFRIYGLRCGRTLEIIGANPDYDDLDQERARQDAVAELIPAMSVISSILLTQNISIVMPVFMEYFLNDPDCLHFMEIMKANNPQLSSLQDRLSNAWGL